ncbi:hypothetical protein ACFX1T_008754 [Malus domestica]
MGVVRERTRETVREKRRRRRRRGWLRAGISVGYGVRHNREGGKEKRSSTENGFGQKVLAMATSTYPPPPPYYRLYKDYLQDPKSAPEPPPPIEGPFLCYGANHTIDELLPSLEEQGVRQLYPEGPNIDFKKELRSLNRELQLHILELADILVERPSQYARRVEEISLIFKNLHHLLNSLRPHQARATLIHILELQIQRRKQAAEDIKRRREEAQGLLKESIGTLEDNGASFALK